MREALDCRRDRPKDVSTKLYCPGFRKHGHFSGLRAFHDWPLVAVPTTVWREVIAYNISMVRDERVHVIGSMPFLHECTFRSVEKFVLKCFHSPS